MKFKDWGNFRGMVDSRLELALNNLGDTVRKLCGGMKDEERALTTDDLRPGSPLDEYIKAKIREMS